MASAWEGDWQKRIDDFAKTQGYPHIWDWLVAHPTLSLFRVADIISNAAPIQIEKIAADHCEKHGLTIDWMLDKLVRDFHRLLPRGWTDSKTLLGKNLFSCWSVGFSRKYKAFIDRMTQLICELDVPGGWLPSSKDDAHLNRIRDQALAEVVIDHSYMDPGVIYWRLVSPIWKEVSIYDGAENFLRQFSRVPLKSGLLLAAHWCHSEVCNGGLSQFFTNPTGVLVPEALQAFKAIGLDEWANVLEQAITVFGPSYPREQRDRLTILDAINRKEAFGALDDRFFAWQEDDADAFANLADNFAAQTEN